MQKPFAVPAETMPVPAETIYQFTIPAETIVSLQNPLCHYINQRMSLLFYVVGKPRFQFMQGQNMK